MRWQIMNWTHHSCNYRVSCCCTLCSYSSLKFKKNKWSSKNIDTCNYRFANTYLWERNTTSRYINCKRLFHSEKKVCYMVYTSLVLFLFGDFRWHCCHWPNCFIVKVLLSLGGWNMGSAPFVKLVSSQDTMDEFADNTVR